MGAILREVRCPAVPCRCNASVSAQSERRTLGAYGERKRQAATVDDASVLGRIFRDGLLTLDCGAGRLESGGTTGWCADRRAAVRRSHVHSLRATARARVWRIRGAAWI